MRILPSIHVRQGNNSHYTRNLKRIALGGRQCGDDTLVDTFPQYLDSDMDITRVERQNVLSASYQVSNTFFLKVITPRHLKAHRFLSWWRNTIFSMNRLPSIFASFDEPIDMAAQELQAMQGTYNGNGSTSQPYEYAPLSGSSQSAALLFDYVPNAGRLDGEKRSLKAFKHVTHTMKKLHESGNIHTNFPHHVLQSVPDGEPYMSDPVGQTVDGETAQLLGVGFDIATLLAQYTPYIGAVPGINVIKDYYTDVELTAAYETAVPAQITTPESPRWAMKQLRKSLNELCAPEAADTYRQIVSVESDTQKPSSPPRHTQPAESQTSDPDSTDAEDDPDSESEPQTSDTPVNESEPSAEDKRASVGRFIRTTLSVGDDNRKSVTQPDEERLATPSKVRQTETNTKPDITGFTPEKNTAPEKSPDTDEEVVLLGEFDNPNSH